MRLCFAPLYADELVYKQYHVGKGFNMNRDILLYHMLDIMNVVWILFSLNLAYQLHDNASVSYVAWYHVTNATVCKENPLVMSIKKTILSIKQHPISNVFFLVFQRTEMPTHVHIVMMIMYWTPTRDSLIAVYVLNHFTRDQLKHL